MLSKSGLSIRRFVSTRRSQDEFKDDVGHFGLNEKGPVAGRISYKDGFRDPRTVKRPTGKQRAPEPIIVAGPPSISDILKSLPPLPDETPRSSSSSTCSCEYHRGPETKRSRLCSLSSKKNPSDESLQMSGTSSSGGDDLPPTPPPKSEARRVNHTKQNSKSSTWTFDQSDASSIIPFNDPEALERLSDNVQLLIQETDEAFKAVGNALSEAKLLRLSFDDEEPEKLVTAEVSPISIEQPPRTPAYTSTHTPSPSPPTPPPLATTTITTTTTPKKVKRQSLMNPAATTPRRNPSNPKVKRKKSGSRRVTMKPHRKPAAIKQAAKISTPRRTLTENVSELLTGKLFHKIEADEMLTPGQLEAWKLRRMSELQAKQQKQEQKIQQQEQEHQQEKAQQEKTEQQQTRKASVEAVDFDSLQTPTEPFHLENLPLRIKSAGVSVSSEQSAHGPQQGDSSIARQDFAPVRRSEDSHRSDMSDVDLPAPLFHKSSTFPVVPKQNPPRHVRKQQGSLPSIPEAAMISGQTTPAQQQPAEQHSDDELFFNQKGGNTKSAVDNSEYIFFQSSPYSLLTPGFRHGPLRIAKEDLMPDRTLGADEGLDWTAFHMAILGGAGDWFSDSDDTIRRREAEEEADISEWWDTWGFQSPGQLVGELGQRRFNSLPPDGSPPTSSGSDSAKEADEPPEISYTDIGKDNPYKAHHKWQQQLRSRLQQQQQPQLPPHLTKRPSVAVDPHHRFDLNLPHSMTYLEEKECVASNSHLMPPPRPAAVPRTGIGRGMLLTTGPAGNNNNDENRASYASSMPQSPMLDLRVMHGADGDAEVVPMGYNLGHDLGDFLRFEAEHAYAADYYHC